MSFYHPLLIEYLDGRRWRLLKSFGYTAPSGRRITVPAGFVTDFASVPRFFHRIFPPTGDDPFSTAAYGKAAVIHDFLYAFNGVTRAEADRIFLSGMKDLGVSRITRWTLYLAVYCFGWVAWNTYRKASK
jgi:hypothetical protein